MFLQLLGELTSVARFGYLVLEANAVWKIFVLCHVYMLGRKALKVFICSELV